MKDILLVDDERPFLLSLKDGLTAYSRDFNVMLATTVQEALNILKIMDVDLLVTDLKLPGADGFQLLASTSRTNPHLPVIVMTAFGTPEIEARLSQMNALHYLEKPLDFDELTQTIESALSSESLSYIRGITLSTFLQLVHMEKKTCSLKIRNKDRSGYLFLKNGELLDAQTEEKTGEIAALDIMSWDDTEIEMDNICRRTVSAVSSSLEYLLMEAFRIKDEHKVGIGATAKSKPARRQDKNNSTEQLIELLSQTTEIQAFAMFDDTNFLEHRHGPADVLARLDSIQYLNLCTDLGQTLNGGALRYLQLTTGSKRRHLLFRHHKHSVAITLAQGAKVDKVIDEIFAVPRTDIRVSTKGES